MLETKFNFRIAISKDFQVVIFVSFLVGNPVSTWISSPILRVLKVSFTLFGARLTWKIYSKETLSVISSDPPCKDGITRFTTVPLKALSDQVWIRYTCFLPNCSFSFAGSLRKWLAHFLLVRSPWETHRNQHFPESEKRRYLPHSWSDQVFSGTVVNRIIPSLLGGSLEITLTVKSKY